MISGWFAVVVWLVVLAVLAVAAFWPGPVDEPAWHAEADLELKRQEGRER